MDKKEILRHIDHTLLKPYAVWEDIRILCEEAVEYKTASVCIPPCYVERVHDKFDTLNICTVVGFPLGYSVTAAKLAEVEKALKDGANEIDMVVNISDVKNHQYGKVEGFLRNLTVKAKEKYYEPDNPESYSQAPGSYGTGGGRLLYGAHRGFPQF